MDALGLEAPGSLTPWASGYVGGERRFVGERSHALLSSVIGPEVFDDLSSSMAHPSDSMLTSKLGVTCSFYDPTSSRALSDTVSLGEMGTTKKTSANIVTTMSRYVEDMLAQTEVN